MWQFVALLPCNTAQHAAGPIARTLLRLLGRGGSMRVMAVAALALVVLAPLSVRAQWANVPTPGLSRLADGKPDLNGPTPRAADGKPDLSGVWRASAATSRFLLNLGVGQELPLRPEAKDLYNR